MPLLISYFNLKDGVSEEEFVKKTKESFGYLEGKVEGLGSMKLYQHHLFGANPTLYQTRIEFKDYGTWDRYLAFFEKDAKAARLRQELLNLIDLKTNYDEVVREIPL